MKYWYTFGYVQFLIDNEAGLKKTGRLTPYSLTASHNKTFAGNLVLRINLTSYGAGDIQTHNYFAVALNCEIGLVMSSSITHL
jgi:hypothetical protein